MFVNHYAGGEGSWRDPSAELDQEAAMTYVLFVCNHDGGRSQMAQAFLGRLRKDRRDVVAAV
jgi:hypothetical protein